MFLENRQTLKPALSNKLKLINKIKFAEFIELPEKDFNRFVVRTEDEPLFNRLMFPNNKEDKIISYRKFQKGDLSPSFVEIDKRNLIAETDFSLESFLEKNKRIISMIKEIGIEKFKEYFLYDEFRRNIEDIAMECNLKVKDVRKVYDFINEFSIFSEIFCYQRCKDDFSKVVYYHKVADIDFFENGEFVINFISPKYAQGVYVIDYDKLETLKKKNIFSPEDINKIDKLIRKLELINIRKSLMYRIIEAIVKKQKKFFHTCDPLDLVIYTQKQLSEELGVNQSIISRAICNKSIGFSRKYEKPIDYFLPNRKGIVKTILKEIFLEKDKSFSDNEIRLILLKDFKISVSRRSISLYRSEIGMPSSVRRKNESTDNISS